MIMALELKCDFLAAAHHDEVKAHSAANSVDGVSGDQISVGRQILHGVPSE